MRYRRFMSLHYVCRCAYVILPWKIAGHRLPTPSASANTDSHGPGPSVSRRQMRPPCCWWFRGRYYSWLKRLCLPNPTLFTCISNLWNQLYEHIWKIVCFFFIFDWSGTDDVFVLRNWCTPVYSNTCSHWPGYSTHSHWPSFSRSPDLHCQTDSP